MPKKTMSDEQITKYIQDMPDDALRRISFSVPWQYNSNSATQREGDIDIPSTQSTSTKSYSTPVSRERLRNDCWEKFNANPQINTHIRGVVGRLVGLGFECSCEIEKIQDAITETETDQRNRLYNFWPGYVGRSYIEGELPICFTPHADGFIEVDYIEPSSIKDILWHPTKTLMPLFYDVEFENLNDSHQSTLQIPSIYIARYPNELLKIARKVHGFNEDNQKGVKTSNNKFKKIGGYNKFIVMWSHSYVTERAVGYLRTVLTWLNKYEELKNWEIDWKKAATAYVWEVSIADPKSFKLWLSLSDEDKRKTGIAAPKTPGGTLIMPPGMSIDAKNPKLPQISDSDTDVLDLVISGLNESESSLMGKNRGVHASVKESKGPMTDRTSDEIAYFSRFLRYDFWGSVFFLKNKVSDFPEFFANYEAYAFNKNGEPKFKNKKRRPEELIDFQFPVSESIDMEGRSKAMLGTKHGPLSETIGVPMSAISSKLGFGGYGRLRLKKATEAEKYPELIYTLDAESLQEKKEAEPGLKAQGENNAKK